MFLKVVACALAALLAALGLAIFMRGVRTCNEEAELPSTHEETDEL